jgi:hypothetical protein
MKTFIFAYCVLKCGNINGNTNLIIEEYILRTNLQDNDYEKLQ